MNTELADHMRDITAFISARYRDDEEGAMALVGIKDNMTVDEYADAFMRTGDLLLGMTDFLISNLKFLAILTGLNPDNVMDTLTMTMVKVTEGMV